MKALVLSGGAAHGAFQAGAIQALEDVGWEPDLVCGTSVGSINGSAYASGISGSDLCEIWLDVENSDVYRWRSLKDWTKFWKWKYIFNTNPLRNFLNNRIDFDALSESEILATCFSVDVQSGRLNGYVNRRDLCSDDFLTKYNPTKLDVNSIMASTAVPIVFPWINGNWDGGIRQYAPLKPAVLLGADEIVIVSLNVTEERYPEGLIQSILQIMNVASISHLKNDLRLLKQRNGIGDYRTIKTNLVTPDKNLEYSLFNFSSENKIDAMRQGYNQTIKEVGHVY